jgi:hypothetical protein
LNSNSLWDEFFFGTAYYFHGATFPMTEMIIENPRTGVDLEFGINESCDDSAVYLEKYEGPPGDDADLLYSNQQVRLPVPLPGGIGDDFSYPAVEVFFKGPPGVLTGPQLPRELNLDDWPLADISFYDNWVYDISDTRIEATIYSLTPVPFESVPGDFDADADADERDYAIWRAMFGNSEVVEDVIDADGSGNGEIDAADYVVWRHAIGQSAGINAAAGKSVPEPRSFAVATIAVLAVIASGRATRYTHG